MEFVFVPLGPELAQKIGIPPDRGVPVPTEALRQRAATGSFDLGTMAEGIERFRLAHPEDRTYDGFLKTYHHFVGATLANQDRLAEAVEHFEQALALDPRDDQIRADLARAAYELRRFDRALPLLRELVDHGRATLETLEALARIHLSLGESALALAAAQEARRRFPEAWESADLLSTVHYHNRDIARLESALHEQLALDPTHVLTLEKLAVYYRECARHGEAKTCIERAIRLDPANPRLRYQAGMIHFGLGRAAEAEAEFLCALELEPDHLDTLHGLGLLYLSAARPQEARSAFERATVMAPRDYRGPMNLGRWCLERGGDERREALDWFRRAVDLGMDDDAALETVVIAARELGDADLAHKADRMLARSAGRAGARVGESGRQSPD